MTEFDLIPKDYRVRQELRGKAKLGVGVFGCLLIVSAIMYVGLGYLSDKMMVQIKTLKQQQSISALQVNAVKQLTDERDQLESQLSFLMGLRGGAEAPMMFVAIGRALVPEEVWFDSWEFQRAGSEVAPDQRIRASEYVITIPPVADATQQHLWMIETRMNIRGKALDHAALSRFVSRLFDQREINDVKIMGSQLNSDGRFIQFNLVVTVNNSVQEVA